MWWCAASGSLGARSSIRAVRVKIEPLRSDAAAMSAQQLIVMVTFFVLPEYLQVVLGFDAFETGKRLFPMSISMLAAALIGPKVAVRFGPRAVVQVGLGAMAIASLVLVGTIDVTLNGTAFAVSLIFFGIGAGLLMSQLGNVIMSSVPPEETNVQLRPRTSRERSAVGLGEVPSTDPFRADLRSGWLLLSTRRERESPCLRLVVGDALAGVGLAERVLELAGSRRAARAR